MTDAITCALTALTERRELYQVAAISLLAAALLLHRVDKRRKAAITTPVPAIDDDNDYYTGFRAFWFRVVLLLAMSLPMLVLYAISTLGLLLSQDLDFNPGWLGYLIMSSFGLASLLSLWAGALVDKIGSRYALIGLFAVIALAFTLMISVHGFIGLVAAAGMCGIAQALANPVTNLLIAEQVPAKKKAGVVGIKQSGVQLAALFAGLVLPSLALAYGWRPAFGLIIPLALLLAISSSWVTPKEHHAKGAKFKVARPNALLQRLMGIQFCVGIALSAFVTFLPTFASQQAMPLAIAGSLIAVFGVMGIVSRIVLTPLGAKLKEEAYLLLILIVITAIAIAVTMQATIESHWRLWAGAIGVGLTAVGTNAIAMSMLIRDDRFGAVTKASGLVSVAFFGGFALGPPSYASLQASLGATMAWSTLIGVLLIGCLVALSLAYARRRQVGAQNTVVNGAALSLQAEVLLLKQQLDNLEDNYAAALLHLSQLSERLEQVEAVNEQLTRVLDVKV